MKELKKKIRVLILEEQIKLVEAIEEDIEVIISTSTKVYLRELKTKLREEIDSLNKER